MSAGDSSRNEEIEVLRAVAVLIVIVGHAGILLNWPHAPFAGVLDFFGGVDLFFVVSGFVITSAYADQFALPSEFGSRRAYWRNVGAFWIRRFFRITPAAWFWLFVVFVMSVFYNRTGIFGHRLGNIGDWLSVALNISNFHFVKCVNWSVWCGNNGVYWSISLEEQFYLAFPFLLLMPRRVVVLALATVIIYYIFVPRTTLVWLTRIDGISLGVLLAFFRKTEAYAAFEPRFLAGFVPRLALVVSLVLAIVIVPGGTGVVSFFPSVIVAISGALVFIASYGKGYLCGDDPFRRILVWVGARSFAIYLLHNPAFWFVRETQHRIFGGEVLSSGARLAIAGVVILALAEVSFRYLETPLRNRGKRVAAKYIAAGNIRATAAQ